jgi:integrase
LHGLRHGWATMALRAGMHPKVVQERLGHANISITPRLQPRPGRDG